MQFKEKYIDILTEVSQMLKGNWRVNQIVSKYDYHIVLSSYDSLYIEVKSTYGESLPQFKLGYMIKTNQTTYRMHYPFKIGCSLNKGVSSIVCDIENRLLKHVDSVLKRKRKEEKKLEDKLNVQSMNDYMVEAFSKSMDISKSSGYKSHMEFDIYNEKTRIGRMNKSVYGEHWNIDLFGLTVNEIINIHTLLKKLRE
ncbi:hypothetical protein N9R79_11945 [Vibrio sp.]|nr:hypothetical protein [Vibrio sp.]